jgi:hypothetical protein
MTVTLESVREAVIEAYCDIGVPWSDDHCRRRLEFRAEQPVSRDEAVAILWEVVPEYNAFDPDQLGLLPDQPIVLARELSVCVYVQGPPFPQPAGLLCQEFAYRNGETRIWWD